MTEGAAATRSAPSRSASAVLGDAKKGAPTGAPRVSAVEGACHGSLG